MSENSPMLPQNKDDSQMLGRDRAVMVPCAECGGDTIRDFFGNWVCPKCLEFKKQFLDTAKREKCGCGREGTLVPMFRDELVKNSCEDLHKYIPDDCYGAYCCNMCPYLYFVYRDGWDIRVDWIPLE